MPSSTMRKLFYTLLFVTLLASSVSGQKPKKDEVRELKPGQTLRREIKRAETHQYKFNLRKDEFFQVRVEQVGINIRLKLLDAKGNILATMNGPSNEDGPETLSFIAAEAGSFTLGVGESFSHIHKGYYILKREAARAATARDRRRVEVERLFVEGMAARRTAGQMETSVKKFSEARAGWKELADGYMEELTRQQIEQSMALDEYFKARALSDQGTVIHLAAAVKKFQEASRLFQEKGNEYAAAVALMGAATVSYWLGQPDSAIEFYKQALPLNRATSDRDFEAEILSGIGMIYSVSGNKPGAIEYLNQALLIHKSSGNRLKEALTRIPLGSTYQIFGESQKALDIFNQILPILKEAGAKHEEAIIHQEIGVIYYESGEYQKALISLNQSLLLRKEAIDVCVEADTLTNIAQVYNVLGEKSRALDLLIKQALPLYKQAGNCHGAPGALNNVGHVYNELGENRKALEYFQEALPRFKAARNKTGEAAALNNMGKAYNALGKYQEALDSYNASRAAYKNLGDRKGEATALTNIGTVHSALGDNQKALHFFEQALPLSRGASDKNGEARALNNIGKVHFTSGEKAKALEAINQALPLFRAAGDRNGEAIILGNAMSVWESLGNRRLAIFYGKQSVNKFQQLRGAAKGIDNETQKSFLRTVRHTYQNLAELLIEENEIEQAVQVLHLYQDQQSFDFHSDKNSPVKQTVLSQRERGLSKLYETAGHKVRQIGSQIEKLKRQAGNPQPGGRQAAEWQKLEAELRAAIASFSGVLQDAEEEFAKTPDRKDEVPAVREVADMRRALDELGEATKQKAATLYTIIGNDKFHNILVTVKGEVKAFESPIKAADLNDKLLEFYALLQSPAYDTRPLGKELYDIIFKPVEADLKGTGAQTLMWQLDGNLRYVPMGALWDGERYLVERYQNVAFTRAETKGLLRKPGAQWTGTGFGNSREHEVDLLNDGKDLIPFPALSGVTQELATIFETESKSGKGILTGEVFSDKEFTRDAFFKAMRAGRPLVHIASHFRFYPGNSSLSFLLLGDGTALTLDEMKKHESLFQGVELLTLSACNTAATLADAEGREIDGFAELAQRLGASAVIATLWQVSDASTPWLMSEFYQTRKAAAGITKSEALRKAQLALLNGTADTRLFTDTRGGGPNPDIKVVVVPDASKQPRDSTRSEVVHVSEKNAPLFKHNLRKPFAHPYYWSPFVLFGNWQ